MPCWNGETRREMENESGYHAEAERFHAVLHKTRRWGETTALTLDRIDKIFTHLASEPNMREEKLKFIDRYIMDHLAENISSVAMANRLYLNPSYFSRYFKKLTGVNFIDYAHGFKMKLAMQMLGDKDESVEVVSMKLGYSDRTYFSKVFKKYSGLSPGEFKAGQR